MNRSDTAKLLGYLSGIDNRQPSEAAVLAWSDALDESITLDMARDAAAVHRRESTEYIQPAHINTIARRIRRERIQRDGTPPIPGGLTYPLEQAWRPVYHERIGAGASRGEAIRVANAAIGHTPPREVERPVMQAIEGQAKRWTA